MADFSPFEEFARITPEQFAFLRDEYEFGMWQVVQDPHDCAVHLRSHNATTGIQVSFSTFRHLPNVSFHRLENSCTQWDDGYGLIYLVRERCPNDEIPEVVGAELNAALIAFNSTRDVAPVSELLLQVLRANAAALRDHATDLLAGDFSVLPQLEEQARREHRRLLRKNRHREKR